MFTLEIVQDMDPENPVAGWGIYGRDYCEKEGNEALARLQS